MVASVELSSVGGQDIVVRLLGQIADATQQTRELMRQLRDRGARTDSLSRLSETLAVPASGAVVLETVQPGASRALFLELARSLRQLALTLSPLGRAGAIGAGALTAGALGFGGSDVQAERADDLRTRRSLARHDTELLLSRIREGTASPLSLFDPAVTAGAGLIEERIASLEKVIAIDKQRFKISAGEVPSERIRRMIDSVLGPLEAEVADLRTLLLEFHRQRNAAATASEFAGMGVPIASARTDLKPEAMGMAAVEDAGALVSELEAVGKATVELMEAVNERRLEVQESLIGLVRGFGDATRRLAACSCPPLRHSGLGDDELDGAAGVDKLVGGAGADLLAAGAEVAMANGTWRENAEAVGRAGDAYVTLRRIIADLQPEMQRASELGRRVGSELAGALEDVLVKGESAKDVLRALEQQLLRVLFDQFVNAPLQRVAGDVETAVGAGVGGRLGGFLDTAIAGLGSLFGFAHGGAFRVGGSGGPDSRLVPIRLSPGELVEVTPPGAASRRGPESVNLNIEVRVSPDLGQRDSFGRTGRQMAEDLARQLVPVFRAL